VLTNDTLAGVGTLTVTNIQDSNENLAVTAGTTSANGTVIHGLFGTLTIGADGSYTYVVDTSNPAVKALGAAQSVSDSFTYTATNGLTSAQTTLTVTVVGINDVPAIGGGHTGSVTEDVAVNAAGNLTTNGTLTITDVDQGQSNFTPQAGTTGSNGFGIFTLTADGTWTYTANNSQAAIQQLGAGQPPITDSFTAVSSDGTNSQIVTVTINGTNDAPVLSNVAPAAAYPENSPPVALSPSTVTITDIDNQTLASATVTITDFVAGDVLVFTNNNSTTYGNITTASSSNGVLSLTSAGNTATLAQWQAALDAVTYSSTSDNPTTFGTDTTRSIAWAVSDGLLNSNIQTTTLTIGGTDDAPVLSNVAPAAAYTENAAAVALSPGTVTITDIDNQTLASATVTITDFVAGDVLVFTNNNSTTYGNITTASSSNGVLSLTSAGNTATLAQWQAALDAVTYSSTSDNPTTFGTDTTRSITWAVSDGSLNSNTQTTTLTITAVNDAAVVSGKISGSVVEAGSGTPGTPTATGTLTDTDVDNPANTFTPVAAGTSSANGYGTYQMTAAGVWTYTLNNSNSTVNALNNGQSLTDTFTVTTVDGTPQPVTIAINGTTDAPFALDLPGLDALQGNGLNKFKTMGTFAGGFTYSLGAGSDAGFAVSTGGVLSTTQLNGSQNIGSGIYTLNVIATDQFGISHTIVTKIWVGTTSGSDIIDLATLGNSSGVNLAYGLNGEDKITGGGGFDFMIGGQQPDTLTAGSGSETFAASGNDTIVFNGLSFSDDIIYLLTPTDQIDLKSLPFVSGSMSATATFNGTVTSLVVSNGTTNVTLTLGGDYSSSTWQFAKDAGTGTIFHDPPADSGTATTTPELAGASPASMLTTDPDTVSFISGTNQVIGTDTTATNGDILTGGAGTDTLTIDTGPGISHTYAFGDGASGHSDIGLNKFENLTLTDQNADANNEATITVTFNSDFQNNGALTVDGSALHDLNGTNLTVDAYLAAHDSFTFIGSAGADTLIGGPQNDTFIGGGGGDTMKGGGGSDTFVFKATTDSQPGTGNFDTITDFIAGSDRIDLSAIVGASHVQGLVGTANTVAANSISWFADGAHNETIVYVNTSGAANHVDMEIHLVGANINLSGADILHH
jgi:VCBS repeat-containing protein